MTIPCREIGYALDGMMRNLHLQRSFDGGLCFRSPFAILFGGETEASYRHGITVRCSSCSHNGQRLDAQQLHNPLTTWESVYGMDGETAGKFGQRIRDMASFLPRKREKISWWGEKIRAANDNLWSFINHSEPEKQLRIREQKSPCVSSGSSRCMKRFRRSTLSSGAARPGSPNGLSVLAGLRNGVSWQR